MVGRGSEYSTSEHLATNRFSIEHAKLPESGCSSQNGSIDCPLGYKKVIS